MLPPFVAFLLVMAGIMSYIMYTYRSHKKRPCNTQLSDLPMEILSEIISYLEWDDILRIRQTCRHLQRASCSRSVWLALVKRYIAVKPRVLWLEKPLNKYFSRELEQLILRWKSVPDRWTANQPILQREFLISEDSAPCVHLVEGGRWLLVGTISGSVQYYDLDAATISAFTLIPSPIDGPAEIHMSVDMDSDARSLSFHLGVLVRCRPDANDSPDRHSSQLTRWVQIWRVTTEVDSYGHVGGLTPGFVSSFREEYEPACLSFRLRGQHVAYSLFYSRLHFNFGHRIIIVNWTPCSSTGLSPTRKIIPGTKGSWLALLPNDRLLCYTDIAFVLYDLSDAPTVASLPTQHQHIPTYASTSRLSIDAHAISQPYTVDNSTRFTFLSINGVKGMTVPDLGDVILDPIDLLPGNFLGHFCSLSYNLAATIRSWPTIIILQYAWPEGRPRSTATIRTIMQNQNEGLAGDPALFIDVSSGRVIVSRDSYRKQYILDPSA